MQDPKTPAPTRGVPVADKDGNAVLDKVRRLRYTLATRRQLLIDLGGEEQLKAGLSGDKLGTVLLAGLRHEDPSLTLGALEEMVDMENIGDAVRCMMKALGYVGRISIGDEDGAPTAPGPAPAIGEGNSSQ